MSIKKSKPVKKRVDSKRDVKNEIDEGINKYYESRVINVHNLKLNCKFKNKKQKDMYDTIMKNRITFVHGVAGTGKTLVSLMAALECIKNPNININRISLTKPIVEITESKGIGALPGDLEEKTFNYFAHFYDNLDKIVGNTTTKYLKESGVIKENILNFLRGNTFGTYDLSGKPIGNFCILDEAQNSTKKEMLTFISRMGEESKLIIMGDTDQIDIKLPKGEKSGLEDAIHRLQGIPNIGFCEFTEDDIVRDPFLIEIMKRYKNN